MRILSQRLLILVGLLLCLSGFTHALIYATDFWLRGSEWEGPLSWRKPILFGLSTGVTALSLAWVWRHFPSRWGDAGFCFILAISLFVEVALISLQKWRGVPSHFNHETPFDDAISWIMTALITVATLLIALLTVYSFGRVYAPLTQIVAIRWGLVLLLVSCLIGAVIQTTGGSLFGTAGVLKFPHGMSIHAIQVLPILAWLLPRGATWAVHLAGSGYALLTVYALVQAFSGRARFDFTPTSGILLLFGALLLVGSFTYALMCGRLIRRRDPVE